MHDHFNPWDAATVSIATGMAYPSAFLRAPGLPCFGLLQFDVQQLVEDSVDGRKSPASSQRTLSMSNSPSDRAWKQRDRQESEQQQWHECEGSPERYYVHESAFFTCRFELEDDFGCASR